jgi:DNA-binding response OmpR family regulator
MSAIESAKRHTQRRILFVDADADMHRQVHRGLTRQGHDVFVLPTGGEALERAIASKPHLIVLDVALPDCDGRDVLARLKANETTRRIAVLVWSDGRKHRESDRRIALDLGAEDFVEKLDITLLLRKIESLVLREPVELRGGQLSQGSWWPSAKPASWGKQ